MKEINRQYSMSDADLMLFASNLVGNMTRDATEFAARGVDSTDISDFNDLNDDFEVFPSDSSMKGLVKVAVSAKNNLRDTVTIHIQLISSFFEQKWGSDSGQYFRLGVKNIQRMRESQFLKTARGVVVVSEEYLTELTNEGLTQFMIDDLSTDTEGFETALNDVESAVENRDIKTRERVAKGNEVFSFVQKYTKIGKFIWQNVDEAKYDDYVITKSVHSGLSKPQELTAIQNAIDPEKIDLAWEAVVDASLYDIYVSIVDIESPSGTFNKLTDTANINIVVNGVLNKRNYFKVRAKNASKQSDYSSEVYVDLEIVVEEMSVG